MILSKDEIKTALEKGEISIDPLPENLQYSNSSVDLRLGEEFLHWNQESIKQIPSAGLVPALDPSRLTDFSALRRLYLVQAAVDQEGCYIIKPWDLVLGLTLETLELPLESGIAARVEGRSTLARIGLMVHLTAPTIHLGWNGKIALEIANVGPWEIKLRPNDLRICQLVFERVGESPVATGPNPNSKDKHPPAVHRNTPPSLQTPPRVKMPSTLPTQPPKA